MGTSVANVGNPNGFRHWSRINGEMVVVEEAFRYHLGSASIGTTAPTIYQTDVADLHDAAVQGASAFASQAASTWGSWWSTLLSDADNAGLQGTLDDPRRVAHAHYLLPVRVTIP